MGDRVLRRCELVPERVPGTIATLEDTPGGSMKTRTAISLCLAVAVPLAARAQEPSATRGFDARLTQYAYPFPVAMAPVRAQQQDLEMAYMDVPAAVAAANGRTVLLLHGKNFSAAYWAPT